jgi:hypothetical protein
MQLFREGVSVMDSQKEMGNAGRNRTALLTIVCCAFLSHGKTDVPVFLLSGQSNMTGYIASVNDLTADQKKTVDNVKIIPYTDGDASKLGKWQTLGPGFGATSSNLGPELYFGRTLSDSMPGKKIALIKDSKGGTYLAKATDWLPPSSNNGTGGTLYNNMMNHIDAALKSFNSAFDTAQYTPRWAGFVWLQGEFDAYDKTLSAAYEKNLTNLIHDIRAKVKVDDLPIIIPMIDVQNQWTNNSIVRAADVAVKQKLKNVDTMDTKGLPTDGTHYRAAGYVKIGQLCAQRWLNMHFNYGEKVPIVYHYCQPEVPELNPVSLFSSVILFDVSGRKISAFRGATFPSMLAQSRANKGIFLLQFNQTGKNGNSYSKKILNITY